MFVQTFLRHFLTTWRERQREFQPPPPYSPSSLPLSYKLSSECKIVYTWAYYRPATIVYNVSGGIGGDNWARLVVDTIRRRGVKGILLLHIGIGTMYGLYSQPVVGLCSLL